MKTAIDRNNPIPYYIQVRETLRERMQEGIWKPGDQLPGEPEMCRMFDVSRTVIRQALNDLVHQGLIVRQKGKGTFVAEPKITESLVQKLTGFYQDMVEQGYQPHSRVLQQGLIPAPRKVAAYLQIEPGTDVIQIERLRFVQNDPIALVTTYLPHSLCPDLLHQDFSHQSLYAYLDKACGLVIVRGHRSIEAVGANEYESRLLQVKKNAPLIMLDSVSYLEDGTAIEYYHALHRGDRSRFDVQLYRIREPGRVQDVAGEDLSQSSWHTGLVVRPSSTAQEQPDE